jgi:hypothetical protein
LNWMCHLLLTFYEKCIELQERAHLPYGRDEGLLLRFRISCD